MEIVTDYDSAYGNIVASSYTATGLFQGILTFVIVFLIIFLIIFAFEIVCIWIIFKKNNVKGWHAIVPILNIWDLAVLGGQKGWKIFIPFYNIYIGIKAMYNLPIRMGKSKTLAILHIFFPYVIFPILAFSKNKDNSNQNVSQEVVNNSNVQQPMQNTTYQETTVADIQPATVTNEEPVVQNQEVVTENSSVNFEQSNAYENNVVNNSNLESSTTNDVELPKNISEEIPQETTTIEENNNNI